MLCGAHYVVNDLSETFELESKNIGEERKSLSLLLPQIEYNLIMFIKVLWALRQMFPWQPIFSF